MNRTRQEGALVHPSEIRRAMSSGNDRPTDDRIERLGLSPDDYYFTEEGYLVFTAHYLIKRGYCCGNGCRHCPYGHAAVKKARG